MQADEKSNNLMQEESGNIRRSVRTKTPSTIYAGIFEDSSTPTKKSVAKNPLDNSGKKSFQKRNKNDPEFSIQTKGLPESDLTILRQEKGKLVSEWLSFTASKGSNKTEKKVCFIINDPDPIGSQGELTRQTKNFSEPSTPKDHKERPSTEFGSFMSTSQPGPLNFSATHSNNTSEKDFNHSRGITQRNRTIRKPKHLNDDFLVGAEKKSIRVIGKANKIKREPKKILPLKPSQPEYKENFLDMILSAAISVQSASKKGLESELASNSTYPHTKKGMSRPVDPVFKKRPERLHLPGKASQRRQLDDSLDSESSLVNEKRDYYVKKVQISKGELIMQHSKLEPFTMQWVKPKYQESSAKNLQSSEIWSIGKSNNETSKQEGALVLIENLPKEETRLKSYFEKQIKKYRPSILARK